MGRKMYSAHDVSMYLDHTVCTWKGSPVLVYAGPGGDNKTVAAIHLISRKEEDVDYTKDDFDYSAAPLGYVNWKKEAVYLERMPVRKTKQGIHPENTVACRINGEPVYSDAIMQSTELGKTIIGEYPSEKEALSKLNDGAASSVAIDRHIAIQKEGQTYNLYYRNNLVGSKKYNEVNFLLKTAQHSSFMKKILGRKVCIH